LKISIFQIVHKRRERISREKTRELTQFSEA